MIVSMKSVILKNSLKIYLSFILAYTFQLSAQTDESWKLFDDSHVARVDITIDTVDLNWI
jgi:hypothetical protein